jgi:hypothetical protein
MKDLSRSGNRIDEQLARPVADRLWYIADAFGVGMSMDKIFELTKIDPWFLVQIKEIVDLELAVEKRGMAGLDLTADFLRYLKRKGFADAAWPRSDSAWPRASPQAPMPAWRAPGLQAGRYLRRRVFDRHRLHVLDLRG